MAIMDKGEILLQSLSKKAISAINGNIWGAISRKKNWNNLKRNITYFHPVIMKITVFF